MRLPVVLALCLASSAAFAQERPTSDDPGSVRVAVVQPQRSTAVLPVVTPGAPVVASGSAATRCEGEMDDQSLRELVHDEAKRIGVDEKLALVILNIESKDGSDLNSPKGARGPMQLMPATAQQYGVKDICNPVENVRGGLRYLKDLSAQFNGNMMLIAAAYNAGSERVYKANGVPPISETVRYVANATNKYYGLSALATRRAKGGGKARDAAPSVDFVAEKAAEKAAAPKKQEWIGGTVLYVSTDEEGDK